MSLSLVQILYNGNKKTVKIDSNDTIKSVIEKAIIQFNITNNNFILKHKNKILDINLPIRYCNISNNAVLDMSSQSITTSTYASGNAKVKLALTILSKQLQINELDSNISDEFLVSLSLLDMLNHFININKISKDCLTLDTEIIIVYIRKCISSNDYSSHTFQSLGLSGQGVRLQIRLRENVSNVSDKNLSLLISKDVNQDNQNSPIENDAIVSTDSNLSVDTTTSTINQIMDTTTLLSTDLSTSNEMDIADSYTSQLNEDKIIVDSIIVANDEVSKTNEMDITNPHGNGATMDTMIVDNSNCPKDLKSSIDAVLSSNFDVITIPALTIILKYITNIINHPLDIKYRKININNKIFNQKVTIVKEIHNIFDVIGFKRIDLSLELPEEIELSELKEYYNVLYNTLIEMNVSSDDLPIILTPIETTSTTTAFTFDPFKSTVIRNAPQPPRSKSITEIKLETLNKKRRELEGDPTTVSRDTKVIYPYTKQDNISNEDEISNDEPNDQNTINKSLIKRMKQVMSNNDDGPPLTTKAVRELDKLSNERVYNKTIIRIKFPDKMILQGSFHPRNTISDVFTWVNENLLSIYHNDNYSFDLYTSPPKCIYSYNSNETLYDLHLVPAALLYLTWKNNINSSDSSNSQSLGYYLLDSLLSYDDSKDNSVSNDIIDYPKGENIHKVIINDKINELKDDDKVNDNNSETKSNDTKNSKKSTPKWFKI